MIQADGASVYADGNAMKVNVAKPEYSNAAPGCSTLGDWNEAAGAAAATREILRPAMTRGVGSVRPLVCLVSG